MDFRYSVLINIIASVIVVLAILAIASWITVMLDWMVKTENMTPTVLIAILLAYAIHTSNERRR